jgi:RNA polymerase sigma factor (sigma-70 family)
MAVIRSFSDGELLANLQSGKNINESIRVIYQDHFDQLSWFVMNNSGSRQDAEDIFQEVVISFIDAVQKNKFRGESSIKTFLYSMNKYAWLNELKKRGRAMQRELNYGRGQESEEADVSQFIVHREARTLVIEIVDQLGEACKKILLMFYYENLSMKDILEKTEYETEQVVRNKKYKCLKQLEQMLNENPLLKESFKKALHG